MQLKSILTFFERVITPLFFLFASSLVLLEFVTHTNYVRELIGLDYVDVFALSLVLIGAVLVRKSRNFYQKYWKRIIFIFPIILFFIFLIINMRYHQFFLFLEEEDSVIEWLQFLFILVSSICSFVLFQFWKTKNKFIAHIFLLTGIGFFIIAGEEISWGQRIFNIETPEEYAKLNTQGETTLHNYGPIFGYVYLAYMYFGLFASLLWTIKKPLLKIVPKIIKPVLNIFIPGWHYFIYFFTAFAYNFERFYINPRTGHALWEEPMELLLFFGVVLFFIELLARKKEHLSYEQKTRKEK